MTMVRYILIENASGLIWADLTAETPEAAARKIDEENKEFGLEYFEHLTSYRAASNESAYFVYTVPADFPAVQDGTMKETIDAVDDRGTLVAVITSRLPDEEDL
jgi:hypothetical protein